MDSKCTFHNLWRSKERIILYLKKQFFTGREELFPSGLRKIISHRVTSNHNFFFTNWKYTPNYVQLKQYIFNYMNEVHAIPYNCFLNALLLTFLNVYLYKRRIPNLNFFWKVHDFHISAIRVCERKFSGFLHHITNTHTHTD